MIDNNLISYIEQNLRNGYSASSIQSVLINQGYPAQNVLDTINYVQGSNQSTQQTPTQSQSTSKKALFILIPVVLVIIIGLSIFFFMNISPKSISEEELSQGINFDLKENKEINFNLDEEVHTINIDSVNENSVILSIQSNQIKVNIKIGEEQKFDLDDDGFWDIKIKLNSITDGIPDLYIKKIHESSCVEDWNCGGWGKCTEAGIQKRECTDLNECGKNKKKTAIKKNCTPDAGNIIDPDNLELDIILSKEDYKVDEEVDVEYYLRYEGSPFKGRSYRYGKGAWTLIRAGVLDDFEYRFDKNDTHHYAGTYDYSIFVYDCEDIEKVLNKSQCGGTLAIKDIVSVVPPVKSLSKNITVTGFNEEYAPECASNDDCTQACANCKDGSYKCMHSTDPLIHRKCFECRSVFDCVDGYDCENHTCVEENKENGPESESYPVTEPDTIMDCYSEDLSETLCSPEKALEFTTRFENRLKACEISAEGSFALGFEPTKGIFRGYKINDVQNFKTGKCSVKFWFLENSVIDSSLLNKEMICEYDPSKRTAQDVNDCFEECCSGELVDAVNAIQS